MRKWGILISVFYVLILLGFIVPGAIYVGGDGRWRDYLSDVHGAYSTWFLWLLIMTMLSSQILLLFLSVDTSQKRLKPHAHILISTALGALLTAILTTGVVWSLAFAIRGDKLLDPFDNLSKNLLGSVNDDYFGIFWIAVFWGGLWLIWGILFYFYFRNSSAVLSNIISLLLKGSILELLVAVPCHVIVRRRQDCSAPVATSFGIATGIAIMLLSFGPSVLFLYKKRLDAYAARSAR